MSSVYKIEKWGGRSTSYKLRYLGWEAVVLEVIYSPNFGYPCAKVAQ